MKRRKPSVSSVATVKTSNFSEKEKKITLNIPYFDLKSSNAFFPVKLQGCRDILLQKTY